VVNNRGTTVVAYTYTGDGLKRSEVTGAEPRLWFGMAVIICKDERNGIIENIFDGEWEDPE
jgi:hypothetical protein